MHIEQLKLELESLTVAELRQRYAEVFHETTTSRHRRHLVRRILWRLQANESGEVSEAALQRARELAGDSQLRLTPPTEVGTLNSATGSTTARKDGLRIGTLLSREYKGRLIRVAVVDDGFEYEGARYRSLTAVVKVVTGSHWNGRSFFGLKGRKE